MCASTDIEENKIVVAKLQYCLCYTEPHRFNDFYYCERMCLSSKNMDIKGCKTVYCEFFPLFYNN